MSGCADKARRSMENETPADGGYSSVGTSAGLWFLRPWVRAPLPTFAPVAQLDRASDFESEGRRFESYRVYGVSSCGCIAQLAEHRTLNPQVEGSIPSTPTACLREWRNW